MILTKSVSRSCYSCTSQSHDSCREKCGIKFCIFHCVFVVPQICGSWGQRSKKERWHISTQLHNNLAIMELTRSDLDISNILLQCFDVVVVYITPVSLWRFSCFSTDQVKRHGMIQLRSRCIVGRVVSLIGVVKCVGRSRQPRHSSWDWTCELVGNV